MPHVEMSGFLDEIGYGVTVITNSDSPKKGHGNPYEKLTPEAKSTLQGFIDSFGKPFIADVARYRGISAETVIANFGQGDAFRADVAVGKQMVDAVVSGISQTLSKLTGSAQQSTPVTANQIVLPVAASFASTSLLPEAAATGNFLERVKNMKVSAKVRAQLFACGLISTMEASDESCVAALNGWFRGTVPADEAGILKGLQNSTTTETVKVEATAAAPASSPLQNPQPGTSNAAAAHQAEQAEARLGELKASAAVINTVAGSTVVTAEMVIEACEAKLNPQAAMKKWSESLTNQEGAVPNARVAVTGNGTDKFVTDAIDAMLHRAVGAQAGQLSPDALK